MEMLNPIVEQRADPHIYLHTDGYYYFTASVPEYDRIELRRAKNLNELRSTTEIITAWTKPDSGPYSDLIWAPEIHYIGQAWYIYFAAAPNRDIKHDAFQHRMYVISNPSSNPLEGSWSFLGQVDSGIDAFCLDATTFSHQGALYYVWAQKHPEIHGNSSLYIAEMQNPTTLISPPVLLSKPEYDWETRGFRVNEGPAVLKRHGRIFITYSASATDANYCMGMLSIDDGQDLLNAALWSKQPEPVFQTNWAQHIYGPGHNSFTTNLDGSQDLLVYHARNYTEITGDPLWDPNRHTCVQPFTWDEQGFPVFGEPQPTFVLASDTESAWLQEPQKKQLCH